MYGIVAPLVFSDLHAKHESMRTLHQKFSEEEFERLERGKGDRTWHEALLEDVAEPRESENDG